jgi:protein-tyrosine phosphatase
MKTTISILLAAIPFFAQCQIADSAIRRIKLQGAINFRDLGGYATQDGRHLKWKQVYRSADISKLSDSDLNILAARMISTVVDLRGVNESAKAPDRLNPNTDYILCPAGSDGDLNNWMKKLTSLTSGGDSMMVVYYSNTSYLGARYKPFFEKLLSMPVGNALLFHCTAGKDRTGIGAALFLYALGVPYQIIVDDYLATNYYRAQDNDIKIKQMEQYMHINDQVAKDIMSANKDYLDATFASIVKQYGSVDNFLESEIGLDGAKIKMLKNKFLE